MRDRDESGPRNLLLILFAGHDTTGESMRLICPQCHKITSELKALVDLFVWNLKKALPPRNAISRDFDVGPVVFLSFDGEQKKTNQQFQRKPLQAFEQFTHTHTLLGFKGNPALPQCDCEDTP